MNSAAPSPSTVLEVFDRLAPPGTPLTTPEVADEFECTSRTIYNKLDALVDEGILETKKVGARGRVWWRAPRERDLAYDGGAEPQDAGIEWTSEAERREAEARASESTFRQLFENVPGCYLILEPENYEIVAVNDAYLNATMTERAEILDKPLFEVFPADPDDQDPGGVPGLRKSLERVRTEEEVDVMPVTYYPIPDRESDDGGFEDRWWSPINSPVFSATGEVDYIIHRVEDVTPVVEQLQAERGEDLRGRADAGDSQLTADILLRGQELQRAKEQAYDRLRERGRELSDELAAMRELQEISTRLIRENDIDALYEEILDAVVTVMDADFARLQLRDPDRGDLRLLADSGFDGTTPLWERVTPESNGPCSVAAETGQRAIVSDVETCESMAGTEDRETLLETGIRAVQSTPLVSRSGDVIGTLSTHWETPHEPSERDLRLLDVLARQATDLIKNRQAEEALRESEERYRTLFESMTEGFCVIEKVDTGPGEPIDFRFVEANPAFADHTGIDDVVGKTIREAVPEASEEWFETYDTVVQTGEPIKFERELASQGRILELHAFPVGNGANRRVGMVFQDVTDRKRRIRALKDAHNQLQAATSAGSIGLWTWNIQEDTLTVDDYVAKCLDRDSENPISDAQLEGFFERVHEDDRERVSQEIKQAIEETGQFDTEYRVRNADNDIMWLVDRAKIDYDKNGEALRMYGAISDITERKQAEEALKRANDALERLNTANRDLMAAETGEIGDRAAELTRGVLDVEYAALWRYDRTTGDLRQYASHTDSETDGDAIRYPDGFSERVWQAFIGNDVDVATDLPVPESRDATASPLRSCVLIPLGRHGVICAGSTRTAAFDEQTVDLAETVAATVETAWDRAEGQRELANRNEELQRLDRLNGLIRSIDEALVEAETAEEIRETVCERLSESPLYEFAWIGERDPITDTITPRAWAGVDSGYVDDLTIALDDASTSGDPVATAARTGELQVVADVATDTGFAPWREATLERGARSCLSVPLVYEESLYGVLSVYADHPQSDERDHAVLEEFGRTIAHAINAVETRESLHTDRVVELTLRCREPNTPLCRLARRTGCTIEFEGLVHRSDGEPDVFFTARGVSAGELRAAAEGSVGIEELLRLVEREDESLFRMRASDPTLAARFVEQEAVVHGLTIVGGSATAVVDLSHTADVREFIERLQRTGPDVELRSRRTRERPLETQRTFRTACEDRLTPKQRSALRTAYLSGFFESPRVRTGEEVAASLDISQPTFANHLRAAQRAICAMVFDEN